MKKILSLEREMNNIFKVKNIEFSVYYFVITFSWFLNMLDAACNT